MSSDPLRRIPRSRRFLATLLLALLTGCTSSPSHESLVRPARLEPGDLIAFTAPASPLDRERMERARDRLVARGFRVRIPPDLFRKTGYLAGPDARRAEELMAAFEDPEVKAIFPGTGGYGAMRILELLDWESIARHPKILAGFSDVTALHLALQARAGMVSFHTPNAMYGLGSENDLAPLSATWFFRLLGASGPVSAPLAYDLPAPPEKDPPLRALHGGVARGRLLGGNLSLVSALCGTPWLPDLRGAILFLEDVGERPYRIDRMLAQLQLAGSFRELSGVVLGRFTRCKPKEGEDSLTLEQIFDHYFGGLGIPVLTGFPAGHARHNVSLPLGVLAELDADALQLTLLDAPTVPRRPAPAVETQAARGRASGAW